MEADRAELVVARIGKPHGLHGEVTVQLHTDDPERRLLPGAVLVTQARPGSGVPRAVTIRSARVHNGTWLLAFEQVPDRTGAESLRDTRLLTDARLSGDTEAQDPQAEEGWYEEELLGLAVLDRDGHALGVVSGLELGVGQDRLVVALDGGGQAYLPLVVAIVPEVDVAGGRVVVDPPPGLLELGT